MLTIKESMELAGKNLLASLLPENDLLPFYPTTEAKPATP
jgi:hypothetical protein